MEQEDAALTIKRIHSGLRREVKNGECIDRIWQDHKTNREDLQKYSDAMVSLAKIWQNSHPPCESRVEWCMGVCREYFWMGGLQNQLKKDLRKVYYDAVKIGNTVSTKSLESFLLENQQYIKVKDLFCGRRLSLLDVGSCFNPFSKFVNEVAVLPVDLHPATNEVYKGDFLEIEIMEEEENGKLIKDSFAENGICMEGRLGAKSIMLLNNGNVPHEAKSMDSKAYEEVKYTKIFDKVVCGVQVDENIESIKNSTQKGNVLKLLQSESFDVVVFSLMLSYLPTQQQRWDCCVKAYRLLCDNGLLLLVESDSAHQHRNAHQIRAWKSALQSIGFIRYRYEKLTHLHCMAFRNMKHLKSMGIDRSELMFIPQDFHDESDEETDFSARTDEQDRQISDLFKLLPEAI